MPRRRRVSTLPPDIKNRLQNLPPQNWSYEKALEYFTRHHNLKGTRKNTIEWYAVALKDFYQFLLRNKESAILEDISTEDIEEYILYCRERGLKPITVNGRIRSLRSFFNYLINHKIISRNPMKGISLVKHPKPVVPTFTEEQIRRLLKQPDLSTFSGLRDYMIMYLLLDTGIRIGELLKTRRKDIIFENGYPTYLIVRSPKNQRQRTLPLSGKTQNLFKVYLETVDEFFGREAPLFPNQDGEPISKRTVQERIAVYGKKAGITGVRVSPHTFRHTFAKFWIMEGGDVLSLQEILGHSDLEMVKNYTRMFTPDLRRKHDRFSPIVRKDF